jgi:uncharacterized membrane protein YhaH (DUF805 family)
MQAVAQAAQAEPEQQNSNSSSQQAQPQETYSSYSYGGGQQSQTQQSYSYSAGQQEGSSYGTGAAYGSASAGNIGGPTPGVGFVEAVQTCFSKYATFEGRARRSEYWFYTLFIWLVQVVLAVVGMIVLGTSPEDGPNILMSIFSLATLVPSLAVFWRRMHDIGKSGAWFFLNLVPCIGSIVLLVFELTDSQPGENQFGMSPKYPVV